MNYHSIQIIGVLLCLSSSAYAQVYYPSNNWGGRIAGIVIGILFLLLLLAIYYIARRRRRRSTPMFIKTDASGMNAQSGLPYSLPVWQGAQTYAPPPGPPPGHPSNTASMNPYEYNAYPGSQPAPPPYMKDGKGVSMPQETNYSSPPGSPPAAHTRGSNRFVGLGGAS
ncbi:hypothetical protein EDB19DRAFT_1714034 [Suillus lakei]|nr:hypothetical protein EDB19DRAFT_1714034 [Suillus lakei]